MTEPRPLSQGAQHRLEQLRHRRAVMAADRAAFQARRQHGLKARHEAKLAYLAGRDQPTTQPEKETTKPAEREKDAA